MSTLIIYATKHDSTLQYAETIKKQMDNKADLVLAKKSHDIDVNNYDTIIIGSAVYAGRIMGSVKKFIKHNLDSLLKKQIGLYICCMEKGEKAMKELEDNYPETIRKHAKALGTFQGGFNFDDMNFLEKAIIKKVSGTTESVSFFSEDPVKDFVDKLK